MPCSDTTPRLLATCRTRRISRRARLRGTLRLDKSKPERAKFTFAKKPEGAEASPLFSSNTALLCYLAMSLLHCFFTSLDETPHNRARDTAGTFLLQP